MANLENLHLGKATEYVSRYAPELLTPVPRCLNRDQLPIASESLPFVGVDFWTAYEISWLNAKGKPQVALGVFEIPAKSPNLVESKSLKLYLNSFNDEPMTEDELVATIQKDVSRIVGCDVVFALYPLDSEALLIRKPVGKCLDALDISCEAFQVSPDLLTVKDHSAVTSEVVYSNLLKSNCLITSQPDWATVSISYRGKQICHESLLRYIISFRNHNEFHEHCVERIFTDIWNTCRPQSLTVQARYTRRGGLDINPIRSSEEATWQFERLIRQ